MKTIGIFGLLFFFLMIAYGNVQGDRDGAAQGPERPLALSAPAVPQDDGTLPARLSEYVFLHQARYENTPVNAMAGVTTCSE